jgi:hypothetical protein
MKERAEGRRVLSKNKNKENRTKFIRTVYSCCFLEFFILFVELPPSTTMRV